MIGPASKIARGFRLLTAWLPVDPLVAAVRDALPPREPEPRAGPLLAVQCVEDPFYLALFGSIVAALRASPGVRTQLIVVRSVNGAVGEGWQSRFLRSRTVGRLISWQWIRAFRPTVHALGYRSVRRAGRRAERSIHTHSLDTWRRLKDGRSPFVVEIDGVQVGDLVIDSYLRLKPSPRFDPADGFTRILLRQAYRDVCHATHYFNTARPELYLTSYSTYLEHGIAARAALRAGVRVVSFGSLLGFSKTLTLDDPFHTPNTADFRARFEQLAGQQARQDEAAGQLQKRLAGEIDPAMSYMKASAYRASPSTAPPDVAGAVVVFMHDFFDSPHIYHDMVFQDFWSWICFTIEQLQAAEVPFYLKAHPNQVALSSAVLDELAVRYPTARLLPPGVTTLQLVDAGMACGVTVYGSVAHELAYLGVPTIACARHPHSSFSFCRTAKTVDEYGAALRDPTFTGLSKAEMRSQALAFYYMQNLFGESNQLELRARFNALWKQFRAADVNPGAVAESVRELQSAPAFQHFVQQLLAS